MGVEVDEIASVYAASGFQRDTGSAAFCTAGCKLFQTEDDTVTSLSPLVADLGLHCRQLLRYRADTAVIHGFQPGESSATYGVLCSLLTGLWIEAR